MGHASPPRQTKWSRAPPPPDHRSLVPPPGHPHIDPPTHHTQTHITRWSTRHTTHPQQVQYRDALGNWVGATVVSVAYDDELVPYYEITLNADGRDKSTVGERLRPAPAGQAPPPPPPDPQALATLASMGFDELTASTALAQTGGLGCLSWVV